MRVMSAVALSVICSAGSAIAQNPDYRVRAPMRTPNDGQWGANESIGNTEFRVRSRFGHVYYGGVIRLDDYKFTIQLDFAGISGFAQQFPTSVYNTNYDAYINNEFVGRAIMGADGPGVAYLGYDSRHAELPDRPLPANFPSPVEVGAIVRIYFAAAQLPAIGDPLPAATALIQAPLEERNDRGDVNLDGHVDFADFTYLESHYDPHHVQSEHFGPVQGDFTGDNRCDVLDYNIMSDNWDDHDPIPSEPAATIFFTGDVDRDGDVDLVDLSTLLVAFGACSGDSMFAPGADLNGTGCVDLTDLASLLTNFGR